MAKKILNNGDTGLVFRSAINDNFTELYNENGTPTHTHDAADVTFTPADGIVATDVQAAIQEVNASVGGTTAATDVTVVPIGNISSVEVQSALEGLDVRITENESGDAPVNKVVLIPQDPAPAYEEGTMYYKDGGVNIQGEFVDVILQVGQENWIKVYNNTGALIPNGSVCRDVGAVNGVPAIALAVADSFTNALIFGVATHDIPNGSFGIVTTIGVARSIDTSAFLAGDLVYLSDTVPGGYVKVPPKTISKVASVLNVDAVEGTILVLPRSNLVLPTVSSLLTGQTAPDKLINTSPTPFINFTGEITELMQADSVAGTFTIAYEGIYKVSTLVSFSGATSINDTQDLLVQVFVNGTGSGEPYPLIIGRNGTRGAGTPFETLDLSVGDVVDFRFWSNTTNGQTLTIDIISFEIRSVSVKLS